MCGSEVSAIEEIIDNSTKPLYGRKTSELKLLPFTYKEAREFFPKYSNSDALLAYSILGGIPLYLSLFDDSLSIKENVIKHLEFDNDKDETTELKVCDKWGICGNKEFVKKIFEIIEVNYSEYTERNV